LELLLQPTTFNVESTYGIDHWRIYEFSHLNIIGMPQNYQLDVYTPGEVAGLMPFELKKRIQEFEARKFANEAQVISALSSEIFSELDNIEFNLSSVQSAQQCSMDVQGSLCIDDMLTNDASDLKTITPKNALGSTQSLFANNFMFNCARTKQPVWARVLFKTRQFAWDIDVFGEFLSSYRNKKICQIDIANDLFNTLNQNLIGDHYLKVQVQLTRRGGIEGNFLRCNQSSYSWLCNTRGVVQ